MIKNKINFSLLIIFSMIISWWLIFKNQDFRKVLGLMTALEESEKKSGKICFTEDSLNIAVTKYTSIDPSYRPQDLVLLQEENFAVFGRQYLRAEAAQQLKLLLNALHQDLGSSVYVLSAYRSAEQQRFLKEKILRLLGQRAYRQVAEVGYSEHQLGSAVDLAFSDQRTIKEGDKEWRWLQENAYKYGFVMSYGKEDQVLTGYNFEPWHWRYVGLALAQKIHDSQKPPFIFYIKKGCY